MSAAITYFAKRTRKFLPALREPACECIRIMDIGTIRLFRERHRLVRQEVCLRYACIGDRGATESGSSENFVSHDCQIADITPFGSSK